MTDSREVGIMMYQGSKEPRPQFFPSRDSGWFCVNVLPSPGMLNTAVRILNSGEQFVSGRFISATDLFEMLNRNNDPHPTAILYPWLISAIDLETKETLPGFYVFSTTEVRAVALAYEIIEWGHPGWHFEINAKFSVVFEDALKKMFENFIELKARENRNTLKEGIDFSSLDNDGVPWDLGVEP